ncbi:phosphonatase-like hydrolase [Arthrobacter jiangjiafuii]|uniref:Phosphonatase-like hydrolase n=1 Tax=Arthrobacter jiangjiafuii TaxID=2817475 RepID=A0A975R1C2_9MICC|nr:phosphonatase-like hydrolase [Arthrobacter jiangjiafuii]MBP3044820.1 phosphonatase-like hydrolase [Arthrobacter jiangjiafuii]QWC10356.1 phosphonatase-like hydrolase [Arthrobacter jiangjiafuii]
MTITLPRSARLSSSADAAPITLAVLDMAGTTITDDGLVEQAFLAANEAEQLAADDDALEAMLDYVRVTMGYSKIVVFRHLAGGNEDKAQRANAAFESAYRQIVADGAAEEIPGAAAAMAALRNAGVKIAMTTGFAVETQTALLDSLGWSDIADVTLTPAQAGRGRPFPDMALAALIATETESVANMIVVGDTANDILTGVRSGAAAAIGVLTGAHTEQQLKDAGATHILASIADLPALLGIALP